MLRRHASLGLSDGDGVLDFFDVKNFVKNQQTTKKHTKFPSMVRVNTSTARKSVSRDLK